MPGKSEAQAAEFFHNHIRESLSVITDTFLKGIREGSQYLLIFEPPAHLETTKGKELFIDVVQTFSIRKCDDDLYRAHTTGYQYTVMESKEDDGDYGILAYHWHPDTTTKLRWPHLHAIPRDPDKYLGHHLHIPTSRICIEDFIFILIRDFHVRATVSHDEWKKRLSTNKTSFVRYANWWAYSFNQPILRE